MATDEQKTAVPVLPQPCWRSPSCYFVGVDLGQAADPTAVCVLEAWSQREQPHLPEVFLFTVIHLMRFPLGMSYPSMVRDIGSLLQQPRLKGAKTELIIDETGVGKAVGDIFDSQGLRPVKVTITAGNEVGQNGFNRYSVPKQTLVSRLDAAMHCEELFFSVDLHESPALEEELKDFSRHVSDAGRSSYAAREGKHDDLVLAVALALWRATARKAIIADRPAPRVIR
jgi:hypothetical protein